VQEELRRLQNQVAQLGRRLQNAPESSSARFRSGAERRVPSYRPQHRRQTLAPRHRTPPLMHRGYMAPPPRRNMWAKCHDYAAPPRESQHDAPKALHKLEGLLQPWFPREREAPVLRWRVENVPITTPQPIGPVVPPASQVPPQARHMPTENQRKRERRRRNHRYKHVTFFKYLYIVWCLSTGTSMSSHTYST